MRRTLTNKWASDQGNGQHANGSECRRHAGGRPHPPAPARAAALPSMPAGQVRVQVVATWTGSTADALRRAQRMTIERFAVELGASPRTVSGWRQKPGTKPQAPIQDALDAFLERAPDRVKAQFAALVAAESTAG